MNTPKRLPSQGINDAFRLKFSKLHKITSSGCWAWKGKLSKKGYGSIIIQGSKYRAHRVAYYLAYGSFSSDLLVCHKCDNPCCVNPEHLWLGTTQQNTAESVSKGRARTYTQVERIFCKRGHRLIQPLRFPRGKAKVGPCPACVRFREENKEYSARVVELSIIAKTAFSFFREQAYCAVCHTPFRDRGKRGHRRFCSPACRWQAWNKRHPRQKTT